MRTVWPRIKSLSRIKKILLTGFLLVSIFIATLSGLMSTEFGSHWVVRKLANHVDLKLGELHGNLLTGLDVTSIDYRKDDLSLHAEKISFRWQPLGLFFTEVNVQSLFAEKIRLHLPPSKNAPEPESYEWPSLAQPVRIKLEKINLRDIQIQQGENLIPVQAIHGSLGSGTFHLRAQDLTLSNEKAKVQLNGSMGLRYPYGLNVDANWQFRDKNVFPEQLSGQLKLGGDIKTLKLQQGLTQPLNIKLTASISPALHLPKEKPFVDIALEWPEQALPADWTKYVNFRLNQLEQSAQTEPVKNTVGLTSGNIKLAGWLDTFKLQAQIQVSSSLNAFVVNGVAQGSFDAQKKFLNAQLDKFTVLAKSADEEQSSNVISASGDIRGSSAWQWNLMLNTEHFNLNQFIENWPSDLQAGVSVQGKYDPQQKNSSSSGVTLAFNNLNLQGDLRGLAVSARGKLDFDGEHWSSSDANLAIGANQLSLKGQAGNELAVDWNINAPLLGQIDPAISGSIISTGLISGEKANPRIQMNTQINQLVWHDYGVGNLSLKLNPKPNSEEYDLLLDASHVQLQSQSITRAVINGAGTLAQHTIEAKIDSPNIGSGFKLSSSWQDEIWRGQWRELVFNVKKIPRWSLVSASPMEINTKENKKSVDFGKLCLRPDALQGGEQNDTQNTSQSSSGLCATSQWSPAAGLQVDATLTAVPANQIQAWLKAEATLSGFVDGQVKLQSHPTKPVLLDAHVRTRDVNLAYQYQGGKIENYPLQKGSLDATVKNDQINVDALLDWADYGNVSVDSKYSLKDKKIQGKFIAALKDLAPLESLLPFLNDVQGSASANMNLAGTLDKPEIFGNISLNKGTANLPRLGLILHDASLQINSQRSGQVHVEAQVTSGDGTLMVRGDLEHFGTPAWSWHSNIYGADIRFIEQPQMTATLSPNLKLSANANAINLTGSTEIPWARAALKTLPSSATRVSSDVVVIENERLGQNLPGAKKSIPFFTDIILYFGDDVRFKGFGLDTQLLGKVNVLKEENRQTFVTGFVAVGKGNYKAYGQDLVIERGRLIFQGPYDNPGLDIRATRALDSGVAGLEIAGTLQHPKSNVFAIPAASDSEAMAMLLTGKTLSQSSQADAYSLIGAISTLGMDNSEGITSDIAHFFHIDEIAVKADKGLDQSALWMGKYLTPKLFIRYIVGLFDQTFSIGVRYQLNEKVRIEAESGKNQSVDVIYKIER